MTKVKWKGIWSVMQLAKCLVLFVEGQTEVEFYKALIKYIREIHTDKKLEHKIIYRSIDGIGGYKKEVNRIFLKEILPKVEGCQVTVALCYDTDVFGYVQKPRINWNEVEKILKDDGAHKVLHIKAEKSIEDWFLIDKEGIKHFLKLNSDIEPQGTNGYEKLKFLFKRANKVYTKKSREVKGLVQALNIGLISRGVEKSLDLLYEELGVWGK